MLPDIDIEKLLQRYGTGRYRPATFLERGLALPLTTPHLLGARVRPAERKGLEIVLPNPAEAEGMYILPWSALFDVCAPSLHDRALWERVGGLPVLSPSSVRETARRLAAEGYAGRPAQRAAESRAHERRDARARTEYELLLMLLRQGEPAGHGMVEPHRDTPDNIRLRVRAVLRQELSEVPGGRALAALEEMATLYESIGLRPGAQAAPLQHMVAALEAMVRDITAWAGARPAEGRTCPDLIVAATELTLRCTRAALAEAHAQVADLIDLLRRWDSDAGKARAIAARPDWLVDGWDQIHGVWQAAGAEGQATALEDMALMVPVIPAEARDWLGFEAEGDMERHRRGLRTWRRSVLAKQDWLTGRILQTLERGEKLRVLCA